MAEDYYKTLGVNRDASADDIQKAYRKLARKYHPDMNPDDKTAKKKFQEVQSAFDVLSDSKKRQMFDQYGSAAFEGAGPGGPRPQGPFGGAPGGAGFDFSQIFGAGGMPEGFADLFGQMGGGRRGAPGGGRRRRAAEPVRGADLEASIEVSLNVAVLGGEQDLGIRRNDREERITVKIPAGIEDGKKMRLRGQGQPGPEGGPNGDLLLTVHVQSHPYFSRRGEHLYLRLPITLREAVEGAKVEVPTPKGIVTLRIPPHTSSGTKLRIKGHGVAQRDATSGDLYVEPQIMLPPKIESGDVEWIRQWDERQPSQPRDKVHW